MEAQTLINLLLGAVLAGVGWAARELWGAIKRLRDDVQKIEVDLPKSYVAKVDLDKRMDHIETMIQRIYDKLDGKADKE